MNICGIMGRLPQEVLAMTPRDTDLLVRAWNAAQAAASGEVAPMKVDRFHDLKRQYPDG